MTFRLRAHHYAAGASVMVGVSFLVERYNLVSPSVTGPASLMSWAASVTPLPDRPLQLWGILFVVGGILISLPTTPLLRSIFLVFGAVTWTVFAFSSLYSSLVGPRADDTGSLVGLLLSMVVLLFFSSINRVPEDFPRRSRFHARQSGKVPE